MKVFLWICQRESGWIDRFSIFTDFVMQMRTGGMAGIARQSDRLAGCDALAYLHRDLGEMAIVDLVRPVLHDHQVAIALVAPPGVDDFPAQGRFRGCTDDHAKIQAVVAWMPVLGQWSVNG